jgi:hypothetical protein
LPKFQPKSHHLHLYRTQTRRRKRKKKGKVRKVTKNHTMMMSQALMLGLLMWWKILKNQKTKKRRKSRGEHTPAPPTLILITQLL